MVKKVPQGSKLTSYGPLFRRHRGDFCVHKIPTMIDGSAPAAFKFSCVYKRGESEMERLLPQWVRGAQSIDPPGLTTF